MKKVRRKDDLKGHSEESSAFTLMELLLAITLFSIIAVAIYSSLAAGIKIQKRGSYLGGEYHDLRLAFYRIAQDLRTAIPINNIYLAEESEKLCFFSIMPTLSGGREIYKITYTWKQEKDYLILSRLKETYIDSLQEVHAKSDKLLDKITQLTFDYGYIKKAMSGKEDFYWKQNWKEEAMPKLVRIKLKTKTEKFDKVIYCPAGKLVEMKKE